MGIITDFYAGRATDHRCRSLEDYWAFDSDSLEANHDFIQWMFSTVRESGVGVPAPTLWAEDVREFRASPELRARLLRSLDLILAFYGLERVEGQPAPEVRRSAAFGIRSRLWITDRNHNYLRLSRILDSTATLGLEDHSRALLRCLEGIHATHGERIGACTLSRWRECARGSVPPGGGGSP